MRETERYRLTGIHIHIRKRVCIHASVCAYTHAHMHIHTRTHIHTCTHTLTPTHSHHEPEVHKLTEKATLPRSRLVRKPLGEVTA